MSLETFSQAAAQRGEPLIQTLAARHGIKYGMAVRPTYLTDPTIESLIRQECSIIVAENAMKPGNMEPSEGVFFYDDADAIAAYATAQGKALRGHILGAWHNNQAAWFDAAITADWQAVLHRHISTVAPRYPQVTSWDVVNEATDDAGTGYRNSNWYVAAGGPSYLTYAFQQARTYCPAGTKLCYCDNSVEDNTRGTTKRTPVLAALQLLANDGLVDAFSCQMHADTYTPDEKFDKQSWKVFLQAVQSMGLYVNITELDVYNNAQTSNASFDGVSADLVQRMVDTWLDVFGGLGHPLEFIVWGPRDDLSSRPAAGGDNGKPQRPLPYDASNKPKAMARALAKAFA